MHDCTKRANFASILRDSPSGMSLRRRTRVVGDEWETPFSFILYVAPVLLQRAHNIIV